MAERGDWEAELARAWEANAEVWARAVRAGRIASRVAGADAAIVSAVAARRPARVLDIGCGEGWLARRLKAETGATVVAFDGAAALIDAARAADPQGDYRLLDYAGFVAAPQSIGGRFDVAVFNYALLDGDAPELLAAAASTLAPGGVVMIQTLHPWTARGGAYMDGWRVEDFDGFAAEGEAWTPMPWYFRTLESWLALVRDAGLALVDLREPAGPDGTPLSLLLVAGRTA